MKSYNISLTNFSKNVSNTLSYWNTLKMWTIDSIGLFAIGGTMEITARANYIGSSSGFESFVAISIDDPSFSTSQIVCKSGNFISSSYITSSINISGKITQNTNSKNVYLSVYVPDYQYCSFHVSSLNLDVNIYYV